MENQVHTIYHMGKISFGSVDEMPEVIETSISWIYLSNRFAFKVKKPIKRGLHDYSTLENRRKYSEKEFVINRRICPDAFIQVVPVTVENGVRKFGGSGKVVDYAIQMVRYPARCLMDNMLGQGQVTQNEVSRLAGAVWQIHAEAEKDAIPRFGTLADNITRRLHDLGEFDCFNLRSQWAKMSLRCQELYMNRLAAGYVRAVHGDLYSKNVFIVEGNPILLDALVFHDDLRIVDLAVDVGCMSMALCYHNRTDLADAFISSYAALSSDPGLSTWVPIYQGMMAVVRALSETRGIADATTRAAIAQRFLATASRSWDMIDIG